MRMGCGCLPSSVGEFSINDGADEMENVTMAEDERTANRNERKKGKAYARYKDALADGESGAMEGGGVLPHYDDIDPVTGEERKGGPTTAGKSFTLGAAGEEMDAKAKKLAAIRAKLAAGTVGAGKVASGTKESVAIGMDRKVGEDYYTQNEMIAFTKPKKVLTCLYSPTVLRTDTRDNSPTRHTGECEPKLGTSEV